MVGSLYFIISSGIHITVMSCISRQTLEFWHKWHPIHWCYTKLYIAATCRTAASLMNIAGEGSSLKHSECDWCSVYVCSKYTCTSCTSTVMGIRCLIMYTSLLHRNFKINNKLQTTQQHRNTDHLAKQVVQQSICFQLPQSSTYTLPQWLLMFDSRVILYMQDHMQYWQPKIYNQFTYTCTVPTLKVPWKGLFLQVCIPTVKSLPPKQDFLGINASLKVCDEVRL